MMAPGTMCEMWRITLRFINASSHSVLVRLDICAMVVSTTKKNRKNAMYDTRRSPTTREADVPSRAQKSLNPTSVKKRIK